MGARASASEIPPLIDEERATSLATVADSADWTARAGPAPPLWRRHSDAVNRNLLRHWLPPSLDRVLKTDLYDEMVSLGLYPVLRERSAHVTGIDVTPEVVEAAAARHPALEAVAADVRRLPFEDGSFDAIVSNSTLDHFQGPIEVLAALRELRRVLKPGGPMVVTLDNLVNPLIALRSLLPRRVAAAVRRVPYDVGWTCGPRRFRRLLAAAGFQVRGQTAIMHAPRVLVVELERIRRPNGENRPLPRWLLAAERLERAPTRYLTGHFHAALAARS